MKKMLMVVLFGMSFFIASCENNKEEVPIICEEGNELVDSECVPIVSDCFDYEYQGTDLNILNQRLDEFECRLDELYLSYKRDIPEDTMEFWLDGERFNTGKKWGFFLEKDQIKEYAEEFKFDTYLEQESVFMYESIFLIRDLQRSISEGYNIVEFAVELPIDGIQLSTLDSFNSVQVTLLDNFDIEVELIANSRDPFTNRELSNRKMLYIGSEYDTLIYHDLYRVENPLPNQLDSILFTSFVEDEAFMIFDGDIEKLDSFYKRDFQKDTALNLSINEFGPRTTYVTGDQSYQVVKSLIADRTDYVFEDRDGHLSVFRLELKNDYTVDLVYNLLYAEGWNQLYYTDSILIGESQDSWLVNNGNTVLEEGLNIRRDSLDVSLEKRCSLNISEYKNNEFPLSEFGMIFEREYNYGEIEDTLKDVEVMMFQEFDFSVLMTDMDITYNYSEVTEIFESTPTEE